MNSDYQVQLTDQENEILDQLYKEINSLPTQYLLDSLDLHDCHLDLGQACECISFIRELDRRMNKESMIL